MADRDLFQLRPVGVVKSPLEEREHAPKQGNEGAPAAWILIDPKVRPAMQGLAEGDDVIVLTWLDRAARQTLTVHPRGDPDRRPTGVFSTRSPDRPNPIGLHPVSILRIEVGRLQVTPLEAIDGTPVLDIKPVRRSANGL